MAAKRKLQLQWVASTDLEDAMKEEVSRLASAAACCLLPAACCVDEWMDEWVKGWGEEGRREVAGG